MDITPTTLRTPCIPGSALGRCHSNGATQQPQQAACFRDGSMGTSRSQSGFSVSGEYRPSPPALLAGSPHPKPGAQGLGGGATEAALAETRADPRALALKPKPAGPHLCSRS